MSDPCLHLQNINVQVSGTTRLLSLDDDINNENDNDDVDSRVCYAGWVKYSYI